MCDTNVRSAGKWIIFSLRGNDLTIFDLQHRFIFGGNVRAMYVTYQALDRVDYDTLRCNSDHDRLLKQNDGNEEDESVTR